MTLTRPTSFGWRDDPELCRLFAEDCAERLAAADRGLMALEANPEDWESMAALLRAFHTIRAGSTLLEAPVLARAAHELESLVDWFRQRHLPADIESLAQLRSAMRRLRNLASGTLPELTGGLLSEDASPPKAHCRRYGARSKRIRLDQFLHRFVAGARSTAQRLGKQVQIHVEASSLELDAGIEQALNGSMPHLLLNAVVHGIELPARRIAAGKPVGGHIHLIGRRAESQLTVAVTDDGAGVSGGDVLAGGVHLLRARRAVLSEFAGRRVGLEAARWSVEQVEGTIAFSSRTGQGTTFLVKLPLDAREL